MTYFKSMQEKQFCKNDDITILAIESSCDETAAAIVKNATQILSNTLFSQIEIHKQFGGVVPEVASRSHIQKIDEIVCCAIQQAGNPKIDAIAVTNGPGLVGALLVGVSYAKAFAFSKKLPLVPVNHIKGHIFANFITNPTLEPPFLCLVVSGGHSHIIEVLDYNTLALVGRTRDDAAGEAFDKGARALGLPYPGGIMLEKLAASGDEKAFCFKSSFNDDFKHFDFSFSGYKTALVNIIHNAQQKNQLINKSDIAASYQKAITKTLCSKFIFAAKELNYSKIAIAGGVASNMALRNEIALQAKQNNIEFFCPEKQFCTDNAAMIGCAAYYELLNKNVADLSLNANPARAFK